MTSPRETLASAQMRSIRKAAIPPSARQRIAAATSLARRTSGSSRLNRGLRAGRLASASATGSGAADGIDG